MRYHIMFNALKSWLSSLTPTTQLQLYIAVITTLSLVVSSSTFIYNVLKNRKKIIVKIKRDSDSLLAINEPLRNHLLIEATNKGSNAVIIKQVGIVLPKKNYIDFVDIIEAFVLLKGQEEEIMGSLECIAIPGTLNPEAMGVALIQLSLLGEVYKGIKEEKGVLIEEPGHLRIRKTINAYEGLMKCYNASTQVLTVTPYIGTTTDKYFTGKETKIQLGNLHTSV